MSEDRQTTVPGVTYSPRVPRAKRILDSSSIYLQGGVRLGNRRPPCAVRPSRVIEHRQAIGAGIDRTPVRGEVSRGGPLIIDLRVRIGTQVSRVRPDER